MASSGASATPGRRSLRSVVLLALGLGGCALATRPFEVPEPARIDGLERSLDSDPTDVDHAVALAAALLSEGRSDEALEILRRTDALVPNVPPVLYALGALEHRLGMEPAAAGHFADFIAVSPPSDLTPRAEGRLATLLPRVLAAGARARVESDATPERIDSDLVVVVTTAFEGDAAEEPLAVGLTRLLAADMARLGERVADPSLTAAVLDAMAVPTEARADLATALEIARILGAGRVVQTRLLASPGGAVLDGVVTSIDDRSVAVVPLAVPAVPGDLLTTQKRVAALALNPLNHSWRASDAPALAHRQVAEISALAAFGRGLGLVARGQYVEALEAFQEAVAMEPGFDDAVEQARLTGEAIRVAAIEPLDALVDAARLGERQRSVASLRAEPRTTASRAFAGVGATPQWVLPEMLGLDRLAVGVLQIDVRIAGGG